MKVMIYKYPEHRSLMRLVEAYYKLMDGAASDDCFAYKEGDQRERRYLLYKYGRRSYGGVCTDWLCGRRIDAGSYRKSV